MRKHRSEMIRFAHSEKGTSVWYKHKNGTTWNLDNNPTWDEDYIYIVDDEYASLRKESIDTGIPIQVKDGVTGEWVTPSQTLGFKLPLENYRLEPKEFKYPIYKKIKNGSNIVKFTDLSVGTIVWDTDVSYVSYVGYKSKCWIEHTNTDVWEDISEEEVKKYMSESEGFEYPIYKKAKSDKCIVKFTGLQEGIIVKDTEESRSINHIIGYSLKDWIDHTDARIWEDISEEEIENYKLEQEFSYPIYKRSKSGGSIVKFIGLSDGIVVWDRDTSWIGHESNGWIDHTDTDVWADISEEDIKAIKAGKEARVILIL